MLDQIGGGIGGFVGGLFGNGDREEAMRLLEQARKGYEGIDPEVGAVTVGKSAYLDADPSTRAAQMDALARLQDQVRSGGLDAITRQRLGQVQAETAQQAQAGQQAALQGAARRGMASGTGAVVAQQLAAQGAAQRGSQAALQTAAIGEQNRNAAIAGIGTTAGGIRGQDYERANAQDLINRFNATQRQGAQAQTVQNRFTRQNGIAGVYGAEAGQKNADADRTQRMWAGAGTALGGAADFAIPKPKVPGVG